MNRMANVNDSAIADLLGLVGDEIHALLEQHSACTLTHRLTARAAR
jgi:hypothetical protein